MKITKLHLKNYRQFEDLELDFTYSSDHPTKAGLPLNKVCFIGPNGCGKTTIMQIFVNHLMYDVYKIDILSPGSSIKIVEEDKLAKIIDIPLSSSFYQASIILGVQNDWSFNERYIILDNNSSSNLMIHLSYLETFDSNNFKANFLKNPTTNVQDYRKVDNLFSSIETILKDSKLKYEGYDQSFKNIAFTNSNSGQKFSIHQLSSGIQQLIYRKLSLQELNPKDFIILIDEPETSLFPDIQKQIVKIYSDIGENNQLFFATHSPIIAGQFEKDELFILYFDENGKVKCRKPDVDPRYLDAGGVSDFVFGIEDNLPSSNDKSIVDKKSELLKLKKQIEKAVESAEFENALKLYDQFNQELADSEFITQSINDLQIGSFEEKIIKRYEASK